MERFLARPVDEEASRRIILGLNHEQQHQELALTDIKHAFFSNPLHPSYGAGPLPEEKDVPATKLGWHSFDGGLIEIGYPLQTANPLDFCFDNETPRHKVYLEPFQIANREVTCGEYLEFMSDDAYSTSRILAFCRLGDCEAAGWQAPLYWQRDASDETGWRVFTLRGWMGCRTFFDMPVCHISFFEADAFARWRGCRLPTEAEWECVASQAPLHGNLLDTGRSASRKGARCGYPTTLRGLLGMDGQRLYRLSGIQASPWCAG